MCMCVTVFVCINISAAHLCAVWAVYARSASHHSSALRIFFIQISSNTSNEYVWWMIKYYEALQGVVRSTPSKASIRTKCIAHRCRLYHQTQLEEQVLLSSLLLAHHTHTQKPYSELVLCANGSRSRGCHPFHFLLSVLSQPLRLCKRFPQFFG